MGHIVFPLAQVASSRLLLRKGDLETSVCRLPGTRIATVELSQCRWKGTGFPSTGRERSMIALQPPSISEWNWNGGENQAQRKFCINLSSSLKDYNNMAFKASSQVEIGSSINEESHFRNFHS